jgi:hypothetical protein
MREENVESENEMNLDQPVNAIVWRVRPRKSARRDLRIEVRRNPAF